MTEARARIAAIDAGHRAAVEILSRLGFFPDESPSLGAKPASRTAAVTGDIDYGDDDDLEESARENHVEPKDDRPRVHASLGSESLAQRRADRRSQRRAGRRHAHLMGAQAARDAVDRFYGADSEEARTVARRTRRKPPTPPTPSSDSAKTASSIWRGKQAMRWATPRGFAPRTTPSGRRTPSRRCAGRVADALLGRRARAGARAGARTGARASARAGTRTDARVYA